ncbi:MAG TPA: bifunctional phosphopantothenoylcysteine decarboxylase/phosphopantothenate--cysteine ligase CoaBC, partial [Phycisphaerae bacterium]|nr:bifunctional phosphopantothenoylcysteine decarboxylase/phosphopantothenate--cysteine ligase CoaBC [Phycisphaerae bacterium]
PAMNTRMFSAPPTVDNIAKLNSWGMKISGPASGRLACGDTGPGRMSEPQEIFNAVESMLI